MSASKVIPSSSVFLTESSSTIMMDFAQKNSHREIIGIFFGTIEKTGIFPSLKHIHSELAGASEFVFEDEDYVKAVPIIKDCAARNLIWLGWFHSHPF